MSMLRTPIAAAALLIGTTALLVAPALQSSDSASVTSSEPPAAERALQTPTGEGSVCEDPPEPEPFTDVTAADPGQAVIECLVNSGVTKGRTATLYEPNGSVTRRQMALFLARVGDLAESKDTGEEINALPDGDGVTPFTDIAAESVEVRIAIDRLSDAGIVQGTTATTYSPGAPVTRRQMATFLVRIQIYAAGFDSIPTPTRDYFTDDNGDPSELSFNVLAEEGVFLGDGAGRVSPGADITRRQMAAVLIRKLQFFFEAGDITRLFPEADNGSNGSNGSNGN